MHLSHSGISLVCLLNAETPAAAGDLRVNTSHALLSLATDNATTRNLLFPTQASHNANSSPDPRSCCIAIPSTCILHCPPSLASQQPLRINLKMTGWFRPRGGPFFSSDDDQPRHDPALRGDQQAHDLRNRYYSGQQSSNHGSYAGTGLASTSAAHATMKTTSATSTAPLNQDGTEVHHGASRASASRGMISQSVTGKQDRQASKPLPGGSVPFKNRAEGHESIWQYRNGTHEDSNHGYSDGDEDKDDNDEDMNSDVPTEFLGNKRRMREYRLVRHLTAFDSTGKLREARQEDDHSGSEEYWKLSRRHRKRVRETARSKFAAKDAEGDTDMVAREPIAEKVAEDEPTAKRQKTGEPQGPLEVFAHKHRESPQAPSVGEEVQLFAANEQATQERSKVTVRLPPYVVVEQQAPSVEEQDELFAGDEPTIHGRLKVTVRLPPSW